MDDGLWIWRIIGNQLKNNINEIKHWQKKKVRNKEKSWKRGKFKYAEINWWGW